MSLVPTAVPRARNADPRCGWHPKYCAHCGGHVATGFLCVCKTCLVPALSPPGPHLCKAEPSLKAIWCTKCGQKLEENRTCSNQANHKPE